MENHYDQIKKAVGVKAATLIKDGMLVGIGTGTTAKFFIEQLVERKKNENLKITAVATSEHSASLAKEGGIPTLDIGEFTRIDLTVDGADEIDPQKRLIKGGGGALLREKIVASSSEEMVVIADESKLVKNLGAFGLPVEVVKFGFRATVLKLQQMGYTGKMRTNSLGTLYETDNNNYIFDVHFESISTDPESDHKRISSIVGVVETGFFFQIAGRIILGMKDGHVEIFNTLPNTLPFK